MPEQVRLVLHRQQRPTLVELPPDAVGYGFDNIGEVLSLPPFLMEKYLRAAKHVVDQAADGRIRSRIFALGQRAENRDTAKEILTEFVRRAFRRPSASEEIERYLALFDLAKAKGESFEDSLKVPLQAVWISPHFLFRIERGVAEEEENGVRPLSDHELATRLSYFLWSTMPDEELFRVAEAGKLRDPKVLEQQTRRMLRDPKAKELGENFFPQWLGITGVEGAMPDMDLFAEFYRMKYLPQAMQQEALLLFETIVVEDRSILELVDPDFAWLNGTLLVFYGIDVEKGRQKMRVCSGIAIP